MYIFKNVLKIFKNYSEIITVLVSASQSTEQLKLSAIALTGTRVLESTIIGATSIFTMTM